MIITSTLLKANVKNLNGHVYTIETLQKMSDDINNKIDAGIPFYGELGYPEKFDITMSRVSHRITNTKVEGDCLIGEIEVLVTKEGEKLNSILNNVVFRPRASGRVLEDGTVEIDKIFSFDAVRKETDAFKGFIDEEFLGKGE